jgi:hypothetical protein
MAFACMVGDCGDVVIAITSSILSILSLNLQSALPSLPSGPMRTYSGANITSLFGVLRRAGRQALVESTELVGS